MIEPEVVAAQAMQLHLPVVATEREWHWTLGLGSGFARLCEPVDEIGGQFATRRQVERIDPRREFGDPWTTVWYSRHED